VVGERRLDGSDDGIDIAGPILDEDGVGPGAQECRGGTPGRAGTVDEDGGHGAKSRPPPPGTLLEMPVAVAGCDPRRLE
jgi:hypothetical protein